MSSASTEGYDGHDGRYSLGGLRLAAAYLADLHALAAEAEQNANKLPDFSTIRLPSFSEAMVCHLFRRHGLPLNDDDKQFDRLQLLQHKDLLDRRVLGRLHTIRKIGNIAAHGKRPLSAAEARDLIDDAVSLTARFCLEMRPDIDWQARRPAAPITPTAHHETSQDMCPAVGGEKAAGLATLFRPPQTRVSLGDMFEDDLTADQQSCISALEGFLAADTQRVFLLNGYAGTGKTFLAAGLTEFLLAQGRMFSLAAPTGRAAKVIAKKRGSRLERSTA